MSDQNTEEPTPLDSDQPQDTEEYGELERAKDVEPDWVDPEDVDDVVEVEVEDDDQGEGEDG